MQPRLGPRMESPTFRSRLPAADTPRVAIRVIIADDHPVVREGLRRYLDEEDDIVVIGDLDFKRIRRHLPDLRRGTHLGLDGVTAHRGHEVLTMAGERSLLDLDGELVQEDGRWLFEP